MLTVVQVPRRFVRQEWGGTETVILETSKCLLEMGHHSEVLCPNALAAGMTETVDGVRVRRTSYFYPYWGLKREARRLMDQKGGNLFSFALMRALQKMPDLNIIHLHTGKRLGGGCRYVARKRKIPYVISLHGGVHDVPAGEARTFDEPAKGTIEWGKALGWWVGARRVLDDAAAIICVGQQEQAETQKRYPWKKVLHLPNGVDVPRFQSGDGPGFRARHGISADANLILIMGRIDPQKNQLLAVRVLSQLRREDANVHLLIIGHVTNDDYDNKLTSEIEGRGLMDRVTVVRGIDARDPELVNAYHAADVFVLPSIHEPFGIVILEAWAAGLPVVASRVGGVPSFVQDGKDGILFAPDDLDELTQILRLARKNSGRMASLASAGQRKAQEEYGWDKITQRLVGIYEAAIRENSVRQ
jgi:glycosyltransferase involved in cell wall biosynthesis